MRGMFFVHISPPNEAGRSDVRTGVVKSAVGAERWLLEFAGKTYRFSQVFNADQLQAFSFFDNETSLQTFLTELKASVAALTPAESPEGSAS